MPHFDVLMTCLFVIKRGRTKRIPILLLASLVVLLPSAGAQKKDAYTLIERLHEGLLVLRLPADQSKIDTLGAMLSRAQDDHTRKKIEKELSRTIEARDRRNTAWLAAMRSAYRFSVAGCVMDRELRDRGLARITWFTARGDSIAPLSTADPSKLFMLRFERTADSAIDALVIYGPDGRQPPEPFPSAFILGGLNRVWNSLMGKNHALWRIQSMQRRLEDFLQGVRAIEAAQKDQDGEGS